MSGWAVQMCLWSLNPAVAFRSVSEAARSVILASGTLSPLGSFASEVRCRPMTIDCEGSECLRAILLCNMQSNCRHPSLLHPLLLLHMVLCTLRRCWHIVNLARGIISLYHPIHLLSPKTII